jgi:hypothetical protein
MKMQCFFFLWVGTELFNIIYNNFRIKMAK